MENKGIFNRIGNYLSYLGKRFDDFLDRRPRLKKAYEVLTHPTSLRIIALAFSVTVTVLTGGTIPIIILVLTSLGSMVSIFTQARQLYNAEKVSQEKLIATKIKKNELKYKNIVDSLSTEDKVKFYQNSINSKLEHKKTHKIKSPDSGGLFKGIGKTLRDKGAENIIPLIPFLIAANVLGIVVYAAFLLYIGRKEIKSRVSSSEKKYETQKQINELCDHYQIKEYENTKDLFIYHLEKKSDFQALEQTLKECSKFDENVFKKHKDSIFSNLLHTELAAFENKGHQLNKVADLQKPSLWSCFLLTINPWNNVDAHTIYSEYQTVMPSTNIKPKDVPNKDMSHITPSATPDSHHTKQGQNTSR